MTRPWDDIAKLMEMPATPEQRIMVLPFGTWAHRWYGEIALDDRDGQECVANFEQDVYGQKIPIEFADHISFGLGAAGWYKDLQVGDDGVYAIVDWTPKGAEAISEGAFLYHSPEVYLRCLGQKYVRGRDRKVYSNLITGDSLTNHPFFKELGQISDAKFSEERAEELQRGPTVFRVPMIGVSDPSHGSDSEMALFNRKPSEKPAEGEDVQEPTPATEPEARLGDPRPRGDGEAPVTLADLLGKMSALESKLGEVQAENTRLTESHKTSTEQLAATQSELARREIASKLSALRFGENKQQLAPAHVARLAAFMARLSPEAASFCAAEGETPAKSMQAEFLEIIAAVPSGLVEFGERGVDVDPEAVLDANARYEAAVVKVMAEEKLGRGAAMERVNASAPELAKAAGLG